MAYSTISDVKTDAGFQDNTDILDATVTLYITQADAEIDSALAKNYVLPLGEIPDLITAISIQLASGLLLNKEYGYDDGMRDAGRVKITNAREQLTKIAKKELVLIDSNGETMPTKATGTIRYNPTAGSVNEEGITNERKFTMAQEF